MAPAHPESWAKKEAYQHLSKSIKIMYANLVILATALVLFLPVIFKL